MSLATLAEFKSQISKTTTGEDAFLQQCLNRSTDLIDQICGRKMEEQLAVAEMHDGNGHKIMRLRLGPIKTLTSVEYIVYDSAGTDSVNHTLVENVDYFVKGLRDDKSGWKLQGQLWHASGWSSGTMNYRVTYDAGYASGSIPASLVHACIFGANWIKDKRKVAAEVSTDIGAGSEGYRDEPQLRKSLKSLVAGYRSAVV